MPIKPENRRLYPSNWKEISRQVREEAGNLCEGTPMFPSCRAANYSRHPETGSIVVLTVAHMDHNPANCERTNLRSLCQRCHLSWDARHHAQTAYATRKAQANTHDLFD